MSNITEFTEKKYYISRWGGKEWSDYDGPFDTVPEAVERMIELCEWSSPEMLNSTVLTYFEDNQLNLAKDDNGKPINGLHIQKNTATKNGEAIWEGNKEQLGEVRLGMVC